MTPIRITIPGAPVAQGRPRFSTQGGFPRAYDPAKSRKWKKAAAVYMLAARQAAGAGVLTGAVRVEIVAVFACPTSDHRKRAPVARRRHTKRPDAENCAKAALDAASGVIFEDDAQVCELQVVKWVGAQGEEPRVEMTVTAIDQDDAA